MAKRDFFVDIDLNNSEVQNAVIHKLSSDPSGVEGQIYFNTVSQRLKIYDDDASLWLEIVAGGSTSFSSISSGTNTTAAMTVDTGASLGFTGSGTINANRFNGNSDVSVEDGGTGSSSLTAYGIVCGGTTGTSAVQVLSPSSTSGVILRGGGSSAIPSWSSATYPSSIATGDLLYGSTTNVLSALTITNSSALVSTASSAPSWVALTDGKIIIGSTGNTPVAATITQGTGITITNGAGSISIAANASGIDHGGLGGLGDDDHIQYIFNAPSSDSRNVIQPSNDSKGLIVRGNAAQSKNIFEVQNSGSGSLFTVGYDGDVYVSGDLFVEGDTVTINTSVVTIEDNFVVVNSGGLVRDAGIEVERGLDGSADNARLTFSEGPEDWQVDDGSTVWTMGRKYAETITGDGGTASFVVTHNMKTTDVVVQVFNMSGLKIEPQIINDSSNTVTIGFKTNVGIGTSYRVVVVG